MLRGRGACSGSPQCGEGRPRLVLVLLLRPGDGREERLGGPGVVPGQLAHGSAWAVASLPLGLRTAVGTS